MPDDEDSKGQGGGTDGASGDEEKDPEED